MDGVRAMEMPIGDMQENFRKHAIIMAGNSDCVFNSKTVRTFSMLDKVLSIRGKGLPCLSFTSLLTFLIDFSVPFDKGRATTGTLTQLLLLAETGARSLAAFNVPLPRGAAPLHSLASDVHAWDMTIDQAWCSRRWELPRSSVRWAEISTCDSY